MSGGERRERGHSPCSPREQFTDSADEGGERSARPDRETTSRRRSPAAGGLDPAIPDRRPRLRGPTETGRGWLPRARRYSRTIPAIFEKVSQKPPARGLSARHGSARRRRESAAIGRRAEMPHRPRRVARSRASRRRARRVAAARIKRAVSMRADLRARR